MSGEVIGLFDRKRQESPPESEPIEPPSEGHRLALFATAFAEVEYHDVLNLINAMAETDNVAEFFQFTKELKAKVKSYPDLPEPWEPGPPAT